MAAFNFLNGVFKQLLLLLTNTHTQTIQELNTMGGTRTRKPTPVLADTLDLTSGSIPSGPTMGKHETLAWLDDHSV